MLSKLYKKRALIWIDGQWEVQNGEYIWVSGHWENKKIGYVFINGKWTKKGKGWIWTEGYWKKLTLINGSIYMHKINNNYKII